MTNDEYLQELAQRGDGSLAAWFASEHVETQNGTLDGARDTAYAKNAAAATVDDSREKLEADAFAYLQTAYITYPQIIELLDRQAAITEREVCCMKLNKVGVLWESQKIAELQSKLADQLEANSQLVTRNQELADEIAKRDKGIERLKKQRDEAREELRSAYGVMLDTSDELHRIAIAHER